MPRSRKQRRILSKPGEIFFKPQGVCLRYLEIIELQKDEFEALKLHDYDTLSHQEAASSMNISQPTFSRILQVAQKKLAEALLYGKAIVIHTPQGGEHVTSRTPEALVDSTTLCNVCGERCLSGITGKSAEQ